MSLNLRPSMLDDFGLQPALEWHVRDVNRRYGLAVDLTTHGDFDTPAFMPVGTQGAVKAIRHRELEEAGAEIILGNTYHLMLRPGAERVARLGGLHRFMNWERPILTDSGGFQVFSLRDTLLEVDDDGVTFRSVYDGAPARFSPEVAAAALDALIHLLEGDEVGLAYDPMIAKLIAHGPTREEAFARLADH